MIFMETDLESDTSNPTMARTAEKTPDLPHTKEPTPGLSTDQLSLHANTEEKTLILDDLERGNFLNKDGHSAVTPPWIPSINSVVPETKIFLKEIVLESLKLPWEAASRRLCSLHEATEEMSHEALLVAAMAYANFLEDTKAKLYKTAENLYRLKPNAKKGLLNNTKFWVLLRLQQPLNKTLLFIKTLKESDTLPQESKTIINDIIKASDTVIHFKKFALASNSMHTHDSDSVSDQSHPTPDVPTATP